MKATHRKPPSLADYLQPKDVLTTDRQTWGKIAEWQRAGLVSVRVIARDAAKVVLTDKGRAGL